MFTEIFTESELQDKKKIEIMEIAKASGIPRFKGKNQRSKEELIADILAVYNSEEETTEAESEPVKPEVKESKVVAEVKKLKEKKVLSDEERAEKKKRYIEDAQVGTLVAFKTDTGKVKSAMIKKRSTSKRRFLLETKYGAKYKVSFDDVLWVRTNKRWPKGIFQLLRGETAETTEEV